MFLGFIKTNTSNKHKLVSLSNLPLLFYQPFLFWGKYVPSSHSWNPSPLIKGGEVGGGGGRTFQKLSHLGVSNFLLERGDKPEKGGWCRNMGGCHFFLLLYSSITFTLSVGKKKFLYYLSVLQSFELAMQDSHSSLYSTKTFCHFYIFDPFWLCNGNFDCLFKLIWNTPESTRTNSFE